MVNQEFLGVVAEEAFGESAGEEERLGVDEQMCCSRGGGREGGPAGAGSLAGNPAKLMSTRYRFDFEHITKSNHIQGGEHFGPVAVTLDAGDPLARAAIVDASGCRACRA
ncbi:hypothetical protein [Amycolatopsis rifamycinica]|uniref:hypothetical protein n=1 Tax=Amycolatopsis rifamycinica TaxID=287986 RepID=UPI001428C6EF|nr:hypothetical protein [Amycolatopsis rifamycinica]